MKQQLTITALCILLATPAFAADHRYKKIEPLSKHTPDCVKELPLWGEIQWDVRHLPFVAEGPQAGISGMGMVELDGKIYLAGGFIPGGDETRDDQSRRTSRWAYCYDPKTEEWTRLADLPGRREYTRAIAGEKAVYVMGGACQFRKEETKYRPFGDCFRFEPGAKPPKWELCGELSLPRTHMAVGRVGRWMIVTGGNEYDFAKGGYRDTTIRGATDVLDLDNPKRGWQKKASIPGKGRGWAGAAPCGDALFVLGGLSFQSDGKQLRLRETLAYTPSADQWRRRADAPIPVSGWGAATYAQRYIVLIGGVASETPDGRGEHLWNDQPFVYDTQEDRWYRAEGLLPGGLFNDPGVVVIGDTIYVAGAEGPFGSHFDYFLIGRIAEKK